MDKCKYSINNRCEFDGITCFGSANEKDCPHGKRNDKKKENKCHYSNQDIGLCTLTAEYCSGSIGTQLVCSYLKDMNYDISKNTCESGTDRYKGKVRTFDSGATRDTDENKLDYEGFLSPIVLERYAEYLHKHRIQSDGEVRDSDNWQKGIPKKQYMKSLLRHLIDFWKIHRGFRTLPEKESMEDLICAICFNAMGYLHEILKDSYTDGG